MMTFDPKRTIESSFKGNNGQTQSVILIPKATGGFKIVDHPQDYSCTFFAITMNVSIMPTEISTYTCKLQSVTDILRDVIKKPLVLSFLEDLMTKELSELSKLLDADLNKNNIFLADKFNLNEHPEIMSKNLKIEFDRYQS